VAESCLPLPPFSSHFLPHGGRKTTIGNFGVTETGLSSSSLDLYPLPLCLCWSVDNLCLIGVDREWVTEEVEQQLVLGQKKRPPPPYAAPPYHLNDGEILILTCSPLADPNLSTQRDRH